MNARLLHALLLVLAGLLVAPVAHAQVCGDGAIDPLEGCDDGNVSVGDGCDAICAVEDGYFCVPSLHASGVNPAGVALAEGLTDPHWVWSLSPDGSNPTPGYVARNGAWASLPPGNWVTTDASFGASLNTQADTYWFQNVFMPAAFAGNLTFPVAVSADNAAEVFVNGTSYGSVTGFGAATSISVPSSAFVPGNNVIMIRLNEFVPGTPRGILMYPGGGGILSQCTRGCTDGADCDDGNGCTIDSCISGACHRALLELGATCTSTGICGRAEPVPFCVGCVDTATTATSTVPDLGCNGSARFCDESAAPTCVECETDDHCAIGSSCQSGSCVLVPPVDAGVEDVGNEDAMSLDSGAEDSGPLDMGGVDAALADAAGPDARIPDTGFDAGTTQRDASLPSGDASTSPDSGGGGGTEDGCDCSTNDGPSAPWAWSLLLFLGLVRKRRRSMRRAASSS